MKVMTVSRQRGFTLVEVMVVMVILAIITAIALPSYNESVRRSRRAEAQTAMMGLAQALERYYTNNNTYTGASLSSTPPIFPSNVPVTGGVANYVLSLAISADPATPTAAGSFYTITATRAGPQATDKCGDLTLTASGLRGVINNSKPASECWSS